MWTVVLWKLSKGSEDIWGIPAGFKRWRKNKKRKSCGRIEKQQQVSFQCLSNLYLLLSLCKPHFCGQYYQSPCCLLSLFSTLHTCLDPKGVSNGFTDCVCVCAFSQWFISPLLYHMETWCWKALAGSRLTSRPRSGALTLTLQQLYESRGMSTLHQQIIYSTFWSDWWTTTCIIQKIHHMFGK